MRITGLGLTVLFASSAPAAPLTPSPTDWRDVTIYQIITDRFDDGDPSNNTANPDGFFNPGGGFDIHGGDFAGLSRRLRYLEGLGISAVWISPIPRNAFGAYHGYAATDFNQIDPHWGPQAELEAFIDQGHALGVRTVLDVVAGHGGDLIHSTDPGYPAHDPTGSYTISYRNLARQYAAPFNALSNWHTHGQVFSFTDPEQIVGELFGLDDLRTEDASVRTEMTNIWTNWVLALDADGFRVDTVKHIELAFWQTWAPAVRANLSAAGKTNFFMFGEVFDGSDFKNGIYTGTQAGGAFALDSVLHYPLYFTTNSVFAAASTGAQSIENRYAAIASNYDPAAQDRLVTFLDNHDNVRFLSPGLANDNTARLEVALVFQLTSRGVPAIYYGTEQAFNGGADPADREDMFNGQWEQGPSLGDNFDQTSPLYRLIRRLNQFRRDHPALRRGTQVAREVHVTPDIYAFSRLMGADEVLVILSNDPNSANTSNTLTTTFAPGTVLVDLLDPTFTLTVDGSSNVGPVVIGSLEHHVMVPTAAVTNLEPDVPAVSPDHDESLIAVDSAVVITFSEPMNQTAVEAAFSTVPVRTGAFAWNGAGDTVTFTPDSDWPNMTTVSVLVSNTATDLAGAVLRGGFESIFHTASAGLPDPPAAVGPLPSKDPANSITVDANASDWTGTPGASDTAVISASELIWNDSAADDLGDGDYTYPTDASFTGEDADLAEVRVAWDDQFLHLLIRPVSVNPGAGFFTPYIGVAIDTDQVNGSGRVDLGIESGAANGGADAEVSPQLAWEWQAVLPGLNPPVLVDATGTAQAGVLSAFSQATGVVELSLPLSVIGDPEGQTWDIVVYIALETFDGIREVLQSNAQWVPGGGFDTDGAGNDPDIFDLAGSTPSLQTTELSSYAGAFPAVIAESALVVQFGNLVPVELSGFSTR